MSSKEKSGDKTEKRVPSLEKTCAELAQRLKELPPGTLNPTPAPVLTGRKVSD